MINTITITGRCTNAPEVKSVKGKKEKNSLAKFTIALNKNEETAFFVPVVAWGALAEALEEYVNKGDKITVSGYLAYDEWKNDDGKKRSQIYITAQSVEFMTGTGKGKDNYKKRPKSTRDGADEDEAFYYDP